MAFDSAIGWTHHTDNLWWGCTEVHEGCDNCYARVLDNRWLPRDSEDKLLVQPHWGPDSVRRAIGSVWKDLAKQQKKAAAAGERHRVFVGSMMDIAEKSLPCVDINGKPIFFNEERITTGFLRDRLFDEISNGKYPNLIFLLLSKRPLNYNRFIPVNWLQHPPDNVMFGTSVVNQATARKMIPELLAVNGKHFLSIEPQLDEVHLLHELLQENDNGLWMYRKEKADLIKKEYPELGVKVPGMIDWVICGGESGPSKRPFNSDWGRILRDECAIAGVPFFMKQIDKVIPIPEDLQIEQFPDFFSEKMPIPA